MWCEGLAKVEAKIYAWTGLRLWAVLEGACVELGVFLVLAIGLMALGLVGFLLGHIGLVPEELFGGLTTTELSPTAGILLSLGFFVGSLVLFVVVGFVAARAAGEQEILHAVVAAILAPYLTWAFFSILGSKSPMEMQDTGLSSILAGGAGGFLIRRRNRLALGGGDRRDDPASEP